jgi:hypothetical protein
MPGSVVPDDFHGIIKSVGGRGIRSIVSRLSGTNQIDSRGLIQKMSDVHTSSVNQTVVQAQGADQATFSQDAQLDEPPEPVHPSDPIKFKKVVQKISDKLADDAKNGTDQGQTMIGITNAARLLTTSAGPCSKRRKSEDRRINVN